MTLAVNLAQGASNNVTFRNRVINGAMVLDQRNAGASVTVNNNQQFPVDRFIVQSSTSTQFTAQQSTTAPTGFYNSLLITTSSANASAFNAVWQRIEANNTNDLGLGTAAASTFTVSFWVRSSVTGTFGFYLQNNASSYSYVTTYTINTANTFEYKTITVVGPTAGTWLTTNNCSLQVAWSLGGTGGTTSTLGSWQAANVYNATGSTGISNTASATFYITGVQLEAGTTASPFEYRQYGTEFVLCQRYFETSFIGGVSTTNTDGNGIISIMGFSGATTTSFLGVAPVQYRVSKRATPTITIYDLASPRNSGALHRFQLGVSGNNNQNATVSDNGYIGFNCYSSGTAAGSGIAFHYTSSAEL
jgi:hypothetical protein